MSNTTTATRSLASPTFSLDDLRDALVNREVEYYANTSKVNECKNRLFKIVSLDRVCMSSKTGLRYVTANVIDHDMDDCETVKALHLCSIVIL